MATVVIGTHIHFSTRFNPWARRRYTHITEIIVQSSALYTLAMLCQAIANLANGANLNEMTSTLYDTGAYLGALITIITVSRSINHRMCQIIK